MSGRPLKSKAKKSKKSSKKVERSETAKKVRRDDIGMSGIGKLLRIGAMSSTALPKVSISVSARDTAHEAAHDFLKTCAERCVTILSHSNGRKTIKTREILEVASDLLGKFLDKERLQGAGHVSKGKSGDHRKVSVAGVVRVFKKGTGNSKAYHVAGDAKYFLEDALEQYITLLGRRAGLFVANSERKTVKQRDINSGLRTL